MVSVTRNDIGLAIAKWEKRAKSEMYLDDFLHPKARFWLIDEIEALLAQKAVNLQYSELHAQSAPESSEVESSRVPQAMDLRDPDPRARQQRKKG